ncbi:MAG: UDP-N-acetylmuramate dehydrogenase, partial [Acutalibacteraceae bacterium]|nr:UDP-N-acetylmuramate dehydrogenase [Acutalibacteraceae bacterium]
MDHIQYEEQEGELLVEAGAGVMLSGLARQVSSMGYTGFEYATGIPGTLGGGVTMNAGAYGGEIKDVLSSCTHIDNENKLGAFGVCQLELGYRHSVYADNNYVITGAVFRLHRDSPVEIRKRMDDYMNRRKTKQPVEFPSAGSVFKRPEGYFAGTLIQEAGLKGKQIGGAQVSEKHAGFIINKGKATCKDVLDLIAHIKNTVKENSGIELECEIKSVGRL